jgi:hypothetical protein
MLKQEQVSSVPMVPRSGPRRRDLTGQRFGRYLVLAFSGIAPGRMSVWKVRCDCGTERLVRANGLLMGEQRSCGCSRTATRKSVAEERLRSGLKNCGNKNCRQMNPQPLSAFNRDRKLIDGRSGWCRQCERGYKLSRQFGLSLEQRDAIIASQAGCCANPGCLKVLATDHRPSVDHCHRTGKIRGILCGNCNTALGLLSEDPGKMAGLTKYLSDHPT